MTSLADLVRTSGEPPRTSGRHRTGAQPRVAAQRGVRLPRRYGPGLLLVAGLAQTSAAAGWVIGYGWSPAGAIAIGAGTLAALVALLYPIIRTFGPVKRVPVPDPWEAVRDGIRESSTDELIAMWNASTSYANASSPIQLDSVIRPTVREELAARKIPLCRCGAPRPGGTHPTTCQEGR